MDMLSNNQTNISPEPAKMADDSNGQANDSKAPSVAQDARTALAGRLPIQPPNRPLQRTPARQSRPAPVRIPRPARYVPIVRPAIAVPMDGRQIERSQHIKQPTWAYGVTTVPERNPDPLTHTLTSLRSSGFDSPTLFVDGDRDWKRWEDTFHLPAVCRYPRIRAYGNWMLALGELYIRNPDVDYYAIFQDDFVCSRNLRAYLDKIKYPTKGYWNLYTFPQNHIRIRDTLGFSKALGWRGAGAVALVFDVKTVQMLLAHPHMVKRAKEDRERRHRYIDGGVVEALEMEGYSEYVHNPSLVQHTGLRTTCGNPRHPQANSFRGEGFDLLTLLEEKKQ